MCISQCQSILGACKVLNVNRFIGNCSILDFHHFWVLLRKYVLNALYTKSICIIFDDFIWYHSPMYRLTYSSIISVTNFVSVNGVVEFCLRALAVSFACGGRSHTNCLIISLDEYVFYSCPVSLTLVRIGV